MRIDAPYGTKVKFTHPTYGWPRDIEMAKRYLKLNQIYTVLRTVIYDSSTTVYLQEFPNISFNSVQFDEL